MRIFMRSFLLGIGATLGALVIGQKIYDRGYDDAKQQTKKEIEIEKLSKKKAK